MSNEYRTPRLRHGFALAALAAILGLTAAGLSQCRFVDSTATGVDIKTTTKFGRSERSQRSVCVKKCNETYKQCTKDEDARHKVAKRICDELEGDARKRCKEKEKEIHEKAKDACKDEKKECKRGCDYREGSGDGGR